MRRRQQWDWVLALMPYGTRWKRIRTQLHRFFKQDHVAEYAGQQEVNVRALLVDLLNEPKDYMKHVKK